MARRGKASRRRRRMRRKNIVNNRGARAIGYVLL